MDIQQIKDIKLNFILATARTGSTLFSSMFNMHPNVISTTEEPFAYSLYPKYKNVKKWKSETIQEFCYDFYLFSEGRFELQFGTKKDLETILEKYKSHLNVDIAIRLAYLCFYPSKNKNKVSTVVDKQLIFHFCLEDVADFYPQSKFIILYRDPRDQALARFRMLGTKNMSKNYYKIAHSWKNTYTKLQLLKNKIGNDRFIEIKYEDLVSNPEQELQKICSFIGIEYNSEMLDYHEKVNTFMDTNKDQLSSGANTRVSLLHQGLTQKVNTDKIGFWKKGLAAKEANLVWTICGELAEKIGYKKDENFVEEKITLKYYLLFINILTTRFITALYYASPFYIKHLVKKIRYGKNFKTNIFISKEYYQKTYYSN